MLLCRLSVRKTATAHSHIHGQELQGAPPTPAAAAPALINTEPTRTAAATAANSNRLAPHRRCMHSAPRNKPASALAPLGPMPCLLPPKRHCRGGNPLRLRALRSPPPVAAPSAPGCAGCPLRRHEQLSALALPVVRSDGLLRRSAVLPPRPVVEASKAAAHWAACCWGRGPAGLITQHDGRLSPQTVSPCPTCQRVQAS